MFAKTSLKIKSVDLLLKIAANAKGMYLILYVTRYIFQPFFFPSHSLYWTCFGPEPLLFSGSATEINILQHVQRYDV